MRARIAGGLLAAIGLAFCEGAQASAYAISDKSVSSLGVAFAGEAAFAENASTVYTNPAGMMQLNSRHVSGGLHRITTVAAFTDDGSNTVGTGSNDAHLDVLVPNFYYVSELSPALRAGFGFYSPFGLGLEYDEDWMGRYHTISTDLRTFNLSPALAYQWNSQLAIGASLDLQYADAIMEQAVDFGTLCVAQYIAPLGSQAAALAACNGAGLQPQQDDGIMQLEGDSWAYAVSLGITYTASSATRLGAVYHGATHQELEGTAEFENVPAAFAATFTNTKGHLTVHMPEVISLSISHDVSDALRLLADYTWTGWGRVREMRVEFDNDLADSVREEDWNDTSRYALGAHFRVSPSWLLRAGFSYDETPVPDAEHRSPHLPDADRRWYTVGLNWASAINFSLDMAYAYVSAEDIPIDITDAFGHRLTGTYNASGDFTSLQANWRF